MEMRSRLLSVTRRKGGSRSGRRRYRFLLAGAEWRLVMAKRKHIGNGGVDPGIQIGLSRLVDNGLGQSAISDYEKVGW
jgi:hypothetical protein